MKINKVFQVCPIRSLPTCASSRNSNAKPSALSKLRLPVSLANHHCLGITSNILSLYIFTIIPHTLTQTPSQPSNTSPPKQLTTTKTTLTTHSHNVRSLPPSLLPPNNPTTIHLQPSRLRPRPIRPVDNLPPPLQRILLPAIPNRPHPILQPPRPQPPPFLPSPPPPLPLTPQFHRPSRQKVSLPLPQQIPRRHRCRRGSRRLPRPRARSQYAGHGGRARGGRAGRAGVGAAA